MRLVLSIFVITITTSVLAQTASSTDDAWPLYRAAAERIRQGDKQGIVCPSASNVEYPDFLAFPPAWRKQQKDAYDFNASALDAVHRAASLPMARWPVEKNGKDVSLAYLSEMRNVANQVGDAALYEHVLGDDHAAVGRLRDLLHLADLLDQPKDELLVQGLVSVGIRALTMHCVELIAADLHLVAGGESQAASVADVQALIRKIFSNETDPSLRVAAWIEHEKALGSGPLHDQLSIDRCKLTCRRIQMEQNLAASSLACHLFRFENKRWPTRIEDLKPYLPALPLDAWGPQGFVVVSENGVERPMVFSRCPGDGLALSYRTEEPQYGFYVNDVAKGDHREASGQFRDVSFWVPKEFNAKPTTRPLR